MSLKDEYVKIINLREEEDRKHLSELPDYWEKSPVINAEIELFAKNLQETIGFLDNDCTADQLSWMSEVFEEISAKLQSWDFIDALRRCADKYPEECQIHNIMDCIEYAIGQLNDDVYQQRFPLKKD